MNTQCNHLESRNGCGELAILLHFLCEQIFGFNTSTAAAAVDRIAEFHFINSLRKSKYFSIIVSCGLPFILLASNIIYLRSPVLYEYRFIFLLLTINCLTKNKCFFCLFVVSSQIKCFPMKSKTDLKI